MDEEFIDQLHAFFQENIISLPSNHPFYDTDLVVFSDKYKGQLPLNGVLEKELEAVSNLYQSFGIILGNDEFEKIVRDQVKILLTRRLGLELIATLNEKYSDSPITIEPGNDSQLIQIFGQIRIKFNINDLTCLIVLSPSGKKQLSKAALFINLAHEMVHAVFPPEVILQWKKRIPTLNINYQNLEEQRTITGLLNPIEVDFNNPSNEIKENNNASTIYIKYNENSFRAAFGMPPRVSYLGIDKPSDAIDVNSKEMHLYFCGLISQGLIDEAGFLIKQGISIPLIQEKLIGKSNSSRGILKAQDEKGYNPAKMAVLVDEVNGLKLLLDQGWNLDILDAKGEHLVHTAIQMKAFGCLKLLLSKSKEKLNLLSSEGFTPLESLLCSRPDIKLLDMLNVLLDAGADVNIFGKTGFTVFFFAISTYEIFRHEMTMEAIKILLKKSDRSIINHISNQGQTALWIAIEYKQGDLANLFIEHGADLTIATPTDAFTKILATQNQQLIKTALKMVDQLHLSEEEKIWLKVN